MYSTLVLNDRNGRFANKLFQIAATIATAKKNNLSYSFNFLTEKEHIFRNTIGPIASFIPTKIYVQNQFDYYDIKIKESSQFVGYFQSEKFFENIKQEVLELFEFKENLVNDLKNRYPDASNSCSIHVRRGDYVKLANFHPPISMNYINNAVKHITYNKFFIFSDDINWCKDNFKHLNCNFISLNDYEDFILMSLCKDNIICNSTFSWWAAYLNKNKNKVVISPHHEEWFGNGYKNLSTKDIIPSNWIQVKSNA